MERLIASLVNDNINAITLYAEPKVAPRTVQHMAECDAC